VCSVFSIIVRPFVRYSFGHYIVLLSVIRLAIISSFCPLFVWPLYRPFVRYSFGHYIVLLSVIRLAIISSFCPLFVWPLFRPFVRYSFGHYFVLLSVIRLAIISSFYLLKFDYSASKSKKEESITVTKDITHNVPQIGFLHYN
jgi:hypothetical protein